MASRFLSKRFKALLRVLGYFLTITAMVILILELLFRTSLIDFYRNHFLGLNPPSEKSNDRPAILILGDSFSADPASYVQTLRDSLTEYRVFNSAVPGTSIKEASLMIRRRLRQTKPSLLVYQIYVGNDLFEYKHPYHSPDISRLRKLYWWIRDRIWVIGYINAQLPYIRQSLKHDLPVNTDPKQLATFDRNTFAQRSRIQCSADSEHLQNTILLRGAQQKTFEKYVDRLQHMIVSVDSDIEVKLLIIPHCVQLGNPYIDRFETLGCQLDREVYQENYPFEEALRNALRGYPNLEVINALSILMQEAEPVYFENDPHLNAYGQQVLGSYLLTRLKENE